MKKNQLTAYLLLFISVLIIGIPAVAQKSGSAAVQINFKDLTGKWQYLKTTTVLNASAYIKQPASSGDTTRKQATTTSSVNRQQLDKSKLREISKGTSVFKNSSLEFFPDQTVVKTNANKSDKYTWKKKKNTLTLKNLSSKEKIKVEVLNLKSDTLKFAENFESGSLYIFYLRVK